MAVVMDEYGGTAGVITEKDLLDEVMGEMHENGEPSELQFDGQGRLRAAGTVRLDEIGERLGVDLEHSEIETVGGLVLSPIEGHSVNLDHHPCSSRQRGSGVDEQPGPDGP
jgi:CBS domain containing-hemolysin-like protein